LSCGNWLFTRSHRRWPKTKQPRVMQSQRCEWWCCCVALLHLIGGYERKAGSWTKLCCEMREEILRHGMRVANVVHVQEGSGKLQSVYEKTMSQSITIPSYGVFVCVPDFLYALLLFVPFNGSRTIHTIVSNHPKQPLQAQPSPT
jgi:hypothetical protein